MAQRIRNIGMEPAPTTPAEFAAHDRSRDRQDFKSAGEGRRRAAVASNSRYLPIGRTTSDRASRAQPRLRHRPMRHGVWWCCAWESPKFHTTSFALRPILGSVKGHRTRLTCEARLASFRPLNGVDPRATNCAAISWGAWRAAGLRGESQPIEPDPGHAGGGRDASAAKRTHRTIELPAIAADILERLRAAPAAGALHHQCGGAELHRQHAAGGRRGAVDDDRAEGGAGLRRARRRAADQSRHLRCRAAEGVARGDRRSPTRRGIPWVLDPVFIDRSPPRAAFAKKLVAMKPRALRLNRAEFGALAGGKTDAAALARFAKARRTVVGLTGERDLVCDADAPRRHRQRPSADGARHRDGLRRLGAGRRLSRGRARRLAGRPRRR